jgi:hypothetical protein
VLPEPALRRLFDQLNPKFRELRANIQKPFKGPHLIGIDPASALALDTMRLQNNNPLPRFRLIVTMTARHSLFKKVRPIGNLINWTKKGLESVNECERPCGGVSLAWENSPFQIKSWDSGLFEELSQTVVACHQL